MKILFVPDVHLKTDIFRFADKTAQTFHPDAIVFLGDLLDDFGKENDLMAYGEAFTAAKEFMHAYPDVYWCIGNHDMAYMIHMPVTGTSLIYTHEIEHGMHDLIYAVPNPAHIGFAFMLDGWIITHAGLASDFVKRHILPQVANEPSDYTVVDLVNHLSVSAIWESNSPLWYRPHGGRLYAEGRIRQVAGHTPVKTIEDHHGLLVCDTFSTYGDGTPYGDQTLCLLDTSTGLYQAIPYSK